MENITSPLDERISLLYGKPVRIHLENVEFGPFGKDVLREVHEGILVRRALFGDEGNIDTAEFHFYGNVAPLTINTTRYERPSANFRLDKITEVPS